VKGEMMTKQLTTDVRTLLLLHYERLLMKMEKIELEYDSVEKLSAAFGVGKNYAAELRKSFMTSGNLQKRCGSGRPSIEREDRLESVVDAVREKRDSSVREISASTGVPSTTVWRLLNDSEMNLCSKRRVPLLTENQIDCKLQFFR
jgi:transposase